MRNARCPLARKLPRLLTDRRSGPRIPDAFVLPITEERPKWKREIVIAQRSTDALNHSPHVNAGRDVI